jgi:hypothetical protein
MLVSAMSGCGQIMIREDSCRPAPVQIMEEGIEVPLNSSGNLGCAADRFEIMKAKLGIHGDRLKGGVARCSEEISECWYSSRIAQWAAKHREKANAPPVPKFHPIPTHPALFPEKEEKLSEVNLSITSDLEL